MDNKQAIEEIKRWTPTLLSLGENCTNHTMEAQLKAIASLEAWEKVREDIEKLEYLNIEDGSNGYDKYIEQYEVLKIIDKYKAESKESD